ncbi:MAG: hypothetical protein AB7N76_20935 [Planctomycetota bacterium]
MKLLNTLLSTAAALLIGSSLAMAQGTTGGMNPGAGTGTGGPGTTPGTTGPTSTLDLPIGPPKAPAVPTPVVPDEDDDDDPRDTPPPTIYGEEINSENDTIYYVLDISCSMDWDTQSYTTLDGHTRRGTRMDRAKAELARSITGLGDNFKFNVLSFDCGTRQWQRSMVEATGGNKASAISWVMGQQPTGATGTGPATALALGQKDNMAVVLLTDGEPNCGANSINGHRTMISHANTQGATINVFGIAASGVYRAFCQSVASDSGGSYFDVP